MIRTHTLGVEPSHIRAILEDPWQVTRDELGLFGYALDDPNDRETVVATVEGWRDMHAAYAYTVVNDEGEPLAAFGAWPHPREQGLYRTWFVGGALFPQTYVYVTATIRREMRKAAKASGIRRYESWSAGADEKARRWFAGIGFLPDGEIIAGEGRPILRYVCDMHAH